jgi:hypothetical protein
MKLCGIQRVLSRGLFDGDIFDEMVPVARVMKEELSSEKQ